MLLLGLPKSHPLIAQFFERINSFDWKTENTISFKFRLFGEIGKINRLMGTRASEEIRCVVQQLANTVADVRKNSLNKLQLDDVTSLLSILSSRMALNLNDELGIGQIALQYLKDRCDKEQLSARFFSLLFAWLSQYRGVAQTNVLDTVGISKKQLLDLAFHGLQPITNSMSDVEIAEVVSELKRAHCYPGRLMRTVQQRALLLCSGSFGRPLDIRLLSNSFYALDHSCDPNLIRFFTDKFADHLDDADVLLVSNIAENLQHVHRSISPDFRDLFLSHCERLSSGIVSHMTRLGRVLQFLETIPPYDIPPSFNARFSSELIKQLEIHETRRLPCQIIFPYLIGNFSNHLPDALYSRLLAIIPVSFDIVVKVNESMSLIFYSNLNFPPLKNCFKPSEMQILQKKYIFQRMTATVDQNKCSGQASRC